MFSLYINVYSLSLSLFNEGEQVLVARIDICHCRNHSSGNTSSSQLLMHDNVMEKKMFSDFKMPVDATTDDDTGATASMDEEGRRGRRRQHSTV